MASIEQRGQSFRIIFRFRGQKYSRSLHTRKEREATATLYRLEDNLRRVELGTLVVPEEADPAVFLLSDGRIESKPKLDYMAHLLYIELFRPAREEFLIDPPSHEEVVRLLMEAGRLYWCGEWSESVHPISRLHFQKAINSNASASLLGSLLFLIAHEYGHIELHHLDPVAQGLRELDNEDYSLAKRRRLRHVATAAAAGCASATLRLPRK